MSCGFGAVILFFMIINAQVIALIEELRAELAEYDQDTLAEIERVEQLQTDIKNLEEEVKRLLAMAEAEEAEGNRIREFKGEGDRQYLTGLKLGGERTLILVDRSASMLDDSIINIIRRRNMPVDDKLRAVKWRQAVASVDWLTAQFIPGSEFQIYVYNTTAEPVIEGSNGVWLKADDATQLDEAMRVLRRTVPEGGTNMKSAIEVITSLNPWPDNVILLADGLPTMDAPTTNKRTVTGRDRARYFTNAVNELPSNIPVNVFLYPLEGDYDAPFLYWLLAYRSGGSFISVSKDWP